MKYQLVLQWSVASPDGYAAIIDIDARLTDRLSNIAEVDGHDAGSGEMNIFIETDDPRAAFAESKPILEALGFFATVRAAYREMAEDEYTILWPHGLKTFAVL